MTGPKWETILKEWAQATPLIDELWLHGSRVHGRPQEDSDLDIAVLLRSVPEDLNDVIDLKAELRGQLAARLLLPFDLTLMNRVDAGASLLSNIHQCGRRIYRRAT